MPDLTTLTTQGHVAYLEPWTGSGLLVLPAPGTTSEGYPAMLTMLSAHGYTLTIGDDDLPSIDRELSDGRLVLGLYGLEPWAEDVDCDREGEAWSALWAEVEAHTQA